MEIAKIVSGYTELEVNSLQVDRVIEQEKHVSHFPLICTEAGFQKVVESIVDFDHAARKRSDAPDIYMRFAEIQASADQRIY